MTVKKTTYSVQFYTDAETAAEFIEAGTPELALKQARKLATEDLASLYFEPFDGQPVNEIIVSGYDGNELCKWQDAELRLRLHAASLLTAAEHVLECWAEGDLAAAVGNLDNAVQSIRGYAKKASPRKRIVSRRRRP